MNIKLRIFFIILGCSLIVFAIHFNTTYGTHYRHMADIINFIPCPILILYHCLDDYYNKRKKEKEKEEEDHS